MQPDGLPVDDRLRRDGPQLGSRSASSVLHGRHPDVDWSRLNRMRNLAVHHDSKVNDLMWQALIVPISIRELGS